MQMKQLRRKYKWFTSSAFTGLLLLLKFQNSSLKLSVPEIGSDNGNSGDTVPYCIFSCMKAKSLLLIVFFVSNLFLSNTLYAQITQEGGTSNVTENYVLDQDHTNLLSINK